jgi:hypothetical protein
MQYSERHIAQVTNSDRYFSVTLTGPQANRTDLDVAGATLGHC